MATKGKGRRKKKTTKKTPAVLQEEEDEVFLCIDEPDESQIKEANEIIEKLKRKYKHKIEEVTQEHLTLDDFTTIGSPSKKKDIKKDGDEDDEKLVETISTQNMSYLSDLNDKENITVPLNNTKTGHGQEEYTIIKGKSLDERRSLSRQSSMEPISLTTPENQYTPFVQAKQPKKRFPHFGFSSKSNTSVYSSLPSSPATVNSLAFPSPSQSPQDEPVVINKKAVKALTFDNMSHTSCSNQELIVENKKGQKKRLTRRLKKESQEDIDEWAESINREFNEVDDFQLVID